MSQRVAFVGHTHFPGVLEESTESFLMLSTIGNHYKINDATRAIVAAVRRENWTIPAAAAAVVLAGGAHSLVDFSLQIPAVAALYAFLLGTAVAQAWSSRLAEQGDGA